MLYDSTILYRSFYVFVAASALFGLFLVYLVRPVESHREFVVHSLSTFEIVVVVAAVVVAAVLVASKKKKGAK